MPRRPNTRPTLIYWLLDMRPETIAAGWHSGKPFYCGKTVKRPESRLWTHYQTARKHPSRPISVYLSACGNHVQIQVMETVPADQDWCVRERHWISLLRFSFPGVVNVSAGGDGSPGNILSGETRTKISTALRGRKQSPEHIAKLSTIRKGRKLTTEHKEKVGAAFRGRTLSPEHRAKISASKKGHNGLRGHPRYALKRLQKIIPHA